MSKLRTFRNNKQTEIKKYVIQLGICHLSHHVDVIWALCSNPCLATRDLRSATFLRSSLLRKMMLYYSEDLLKTPDPDARTFGDWTVKDTFNVTCRLLSLQTERMH